MMNDVLWDKRVTQETEMYIHKTITKVYTYDKLKVQKCNIFRGKQIRNIWW
jgi:hypothetical protein